MKQLLVTGGAGFIGSNFIHYILRTCPDIRVVNLDALTYAGNLSNLSDLINNPRYTFVKGDIRNRELVEELFRKFRFDTVVNFAAESHVDRSITEPEVFLTTNIIGTQVLLDAAKRFWKVEPDNKYTREFVPGVRYLQVSTDEVYGALGETGLFTESTPLSPNSPYSASKASADMVIRAYYETYGLPVNITRCSNNYGPYQFPEKLIPLMVVNAFQDQPLPVYGKGENVRDWLYVEDHCSAIDEILLKGTAGELYNIGGHNERTNLEVVRTILHEVRKPEELIQFVQDRPGHDRRYAIDPAKMQKTFGWAPRTAFSDGIRKTIRWYLEHKIWWEHIANGQYRQARLASDIGRPMGEGLS